MEGITNDPQMNKTWRHRKSFPGGLGENKY